MNLLRHAGKLFKRFARLSTCKPCCGCLEPCTFCPDGMNKTYKITPSGITLSTACRSEGGDDTDPVPYHFKVTSGGITAASYCVRNGGTCQLDAAGNDIEPVFGIYYGTGVDGSCTNCQPGCLYSGRQGHTINVFRKSATEIAAEIWHGPVELGFFPYVLSFKGSATAKCDALKIRIPNALTGAGNTTSDTFGGVEAVAIGSGGYIDLEACCTPEDI